MKYIISIDQSTQGTKALLFNEYGALLCRTDIPHKQIIDKNGWISHDADEIYRNIIHVIKDLLTKSRIDRSCVVGLGISNQRETSLLWDKVTGLPLGNAVVWQCSRASEICEREAIRCHSEEIFSKTGIKLSPYFPAAKIAWLFQYIPSVNPASVCCGTMDSYLVYRLTAGRSFKTDYSNASRTQLFNIFDLTWDADICKWFGIDPTCLPEVTDSNACFGYTNCDGLFDTPIPIHAVMGDSHAALFGQNCRSAGMTKATYGTGSSIMMNIGSTPVLSRHGVVTSLAWGIDHQVSYVLEGNLNYTGAVITWLKDELSLISDPAETQNLAEQAADNDRLYLIPAFSGLGAPYWDSSARASIIGMDRTTGRKEIVKAALECIALQIADVVFAMEGDSKLHVDTLRVDGGPTRNHYLMQFQSEILQTDILIPIQEELSAIGVAYLAGMALGLWDEEVYNQGNYKRYTFKRAKNWSDQKYYGWKAAVSSVLTVQKQL